MKIAIVGYGAMGKLVESHAQDMDDIEVVAIAYKHKDEPLTAEMLAGADVAIDFTHASAMQRHMELYAETKTPAVIGTTGWAITDDMRERVDQAGIGVVVGSNFSIGVQIFFQVVTYAARRFSKFKQYDAYGLDIHHARKADSPSGTMRTLAEKVLAEMPAKSVVSYDRQEGAIEPSTLQFTSLRGGHNPGSHSVTFDSVSDEITLTHRAHGRDGFAIGAIEATKYALNSRGIHRYEDLIEKELS